MRPHWILTVMVGVGVSACGPAAILAQSINVKELLLDLKAVEKEEAAAKEIRLKWISGERTRIHDELQKFDSELSELTKIVPDPIKPRVLPPAVAKAQQREKTAFNDWASSNDPLRHAAIMKGTGQNALLRVLGPIAHYRRLRTTAASTAGVFASLSADKAILPTDATHFRMVPATSAGSQVTVRLNQFPLDLQWPPVVTQNWRPDCQSIQKLRDEYVTLLTSAASEAQAHLNQAELLDSALSLLQAKVQNKKWSIPKDSSLTRDKRTKVHHDLQAALRYLETVRATAERFKNAPGDYKVHRFPGGSIEDFLDFCYTHGMIFQEARPADEEHYLKLHRHMQDYAHDVQYVEDWKSDLEQRIQELNADDKKLLWRASEK